MAAPITAVAEAEAHVLVPRAAMYQAAALNLPGALKAAALNPEFAPMCSAAAVVPVVVRALDQVQVQEAEGSVVVNNKLRNNDNRIIR